MNLATGIAIGMSSNQGSGSGEVFIYGLIGLMVVWVFTWIARGIYWVVKKEKFGYGDSLLGCIFFVLDLLLIFTWFFIGIVALGEYLFGLI